MSVLCYLLIFLETTLRDNKQQYVWENSVAMKEQVFTLAPRCFTCE
jgi:hypothetical protein